MTMAIKAHDTFWQRRNLRGIAPKLLEVLNETTTTLTMNRCAWTELTDLWGQTFT